MTDSPARLALARLRTVQPGRRFHLLVGLVAPLVALCANLWKFAPFTIDDAYISFRYARNFADGHGLVYNLGERIEGYTNFLWTLLLGFEAMLGLDPVVMSKVMGAASACGTLYFTYRLAERLLPFGLPPRVATWLLATSTLCPGYSVFGLETRLLTLLVTAGAYLVYREDEGDPRAFPWSALVFAAAGLTRPEAPLFLGLVMLTLGRRFLGRQNLLRGVAFALPIAAHLLWRRAYYGDWLPATFFAKTGDLNAQLVGGYDYVRGYFTFVGPAAVLLALPGAVIGAFRRRREAIACALVSALFTGYIVLVGGDWMPHHRFFAPVEPFLFLLIGLTLRRLGETRSLLVLLLVLVAAGDYAVTRVKRLNKSYTRLVIHEYRAHMRTAGVASDWLVQNPPGKIAIGDIGLVGYRTNYPLLDTLGLVDPVISRLPGGYAARNGEGFRDRIFGEMPAYIVIIVDGMCDRPVMAGSRAIYEDPRFAPNFVTGHRIHIGGSTNWCIYEHRNHRALAAAGVPPTEPRR